MIKKPIYENIQPSFGSSFTVRRFTEENCSNLPYWHCHPEYEIVFISNGQGKRRIGEHISYFENGDLIFLGPNIPHLGFAQELYEQHVEVVVQMKEDFLGKDFLNRQELSDIRQLFERARSGVTFYGHTRWEVGQILQTMIEKDGFSRLMDLLKALQLMARSSEAASLNINHLSLEVKPQDHQRMDAVNKFVEENFRHSVSLEEVAGKVSMSEEAFCRFFKKLNHRTFFEFLNEYRVMHACKLFSDAHLNIADVSFESGFNNMSHFNKQFKTVTGETPTAYRKKLRKFLIAPVGEQASD
jgi:AraC-like DNA-binding protein/quercetin dioxygenase-like cupin family protein